jgi:hypothetical protein
LSRVLNAEEKKLLASPHALYVSKKEETVSAFKLYIGDEELA